MDQRHMCPFVGMLARSSRPCLVPFGHAYQPDFALGIYDPSSSDSLFSSP